MPQIGHVPGLSRTICGCMGQVYWVCSVADEGSIGSSAMPHFGQAPGFADEHLGMHGTGVLGRGWGRGGDGYRRSSLRAVVFAWVRFELCPATLGTEVPGAARMLNGRSGFFR